MRVELYGCNKGIVEDVSFYQNYARTLSVSVQSSYDFLLSPTHFYLSSREPGEEILKDMTMHGMIPRRKNFLLLKLDCSLCNCISLHEITPEVVKPFLDGIGGQQFKFIRLFCVKTDSTQNFM